MKNTEPQLISVQREPNAVQLELYVDEKLSYFSGHFDGFAVLAGVVQVHWAVRFAQEYLGVLPIVTAVDVIKFTRPIFPNSRVLLDLKYIPDQRQIEFIYKDSDQRFSSGKLQIRDSSSV